MAIYERILVDRPRDANDAGPRPAIGPVAVQLVRALRDAGWSIPALAARFDVSRRTIYRYLDTRAELVEIVAGAWIATFYVEPDRQPRQASPWRPL